MSFKSTGRTTDEKQAEFDPRATAEIISPASAALVKAVCMSTFTRSLLQPGIMGPEMRRQCQQIFAFAPLDITDRRVQLRQVGLEAAFKNPITRDFGNAVNETSSTITKSILSLALSRSLVDTILSDMQQSREDRRDFIRTVLQLQRCLAAIALKTKPFGSVMANTIREMGEVALAFEYDAEPEALAVALRDASAAVQVPADSLRADQEETLASIRDGVFMIDNKRRFREGWEFKRKRTEVDSKQRDCEQKEKMFLNAKEEYNLVKIAFMKDDKLLELEAQNLGAEISGKQENADAQRLEARRVDSYETSYMQEIQDIISREFDEAGVRGLTDLSKLAHDLKNRLFDVDGFDVNEGTQDISELRRAVEAGARSNVTPVLESARFKIDFVKAVTSQIQLRKQEYRARISELRQEERSLKGEADHYDAKWRSSSVDDERARFKQIGEDFSRKLQDVVMNRQTLEDELDGISDRVKKEMYDLHKETEKRECAGMLSQEKRDAVQQARDALARAQERNDEIRQMNRAFLERMEAFNAETRQQNKQIVENAEERNDELIRIARYKFNTDQKREEANVSIKLATIHAVADVARARTRQFEDEIDQARARVENTKARRAEIQKARLDHEDNLTRLRGDKNDAKDAFFEAKFSMEELVRQKGISDADFKVFSQIFDLLTKSAERISPAMMTLYTALETQRQIVEGDKFMANMAKVPTDKKGIVMKRIADSLQVICEVGWRMFDEPLDRLIGSDTTSIAVKLQELGLPGHQGAEEDVNE